MISTHGRHLLAEYWGCEQGLLNDLEGLRELLPGIATAAGATVINSLFHRFTPTGVSGVVLVKESHIAVHTWPEQGYAALDFYTCGDIDPERAHPLLLEALGASSGELMLVERGQQASGMRSERQRWSQSHDDEATRTLSLFPDAKAFFLCAGAADALTTLNAFDDALLAAGVGDTNVLRVSSILPPKARRIAPCPLPGGAFVPMAYAKISSATPGERIAAAVAVALPVDDELPGIIMEHCAVAPLDEVQQTVRSMAVAGMQSRKRPIKDVLVRGAEHVVQSQGCAFAGVVLWDATVA